MKSCYHPKENEDGFLSLLSIFYLGNGCVTEWQYIGGDSEFDVTAAPPV